MKLSGVIGTLVVHASVLLLFISPSCTPKHPPSAAAEQRVSVNLLPPPSPAAHLSAEGPNPGGGTPSDPCPAEKQYEGIGILWMPGTRLIVKAPPGYPAYRAGIRVGDMLVNPDELYPRGNILEIDVFRHTTRLTFKVKLEKICFDGSRK